MGGLLVVLHLPLGEALFFVYSAADFEVARLGRGAEKRGGLGALPHTKCTADSRALCLPCRKQETATTHTLTPSEMASFWETSMPVTHGLTPRP